MSALPDLLVRGALALGLGLIIGFQRERKASSTAGIRTFPLFCLIGFFCSLLDGHDQYWVTAAGLLGLSLIISRTAEHSAGVTTEMAALLVFLVGAYLAKGDHLEFAIVVTGACALLLHLKESMHEWVGKLNTSEVMAIMQFVLIALVILPVLPDKAYDPFKVINPQEIWMMVVLITGISLVSFLIQKIVGSRAGVLLSGILGGFISSTATTVTMARLSAKVMHPRFLAPSIMIASTVAFVRVLGEIYIVSPSSLRVQVVPLSMLFGIMLIQSAYIYVRHHEGESKQSEIVSDNPSQLKAAIIFGLLYALILFVSAWARSRYGNGGLFFVSVISGLIDVDAITISTSRLIETGHIDSVLGWKAIMTAFLSNLGFKLAIVMLFAKRDLKIQIGIHFGLSIIAGCLILFFMK